VRSVGSLFIKEILELHLILKIIVCKFKNRDNHQRSFQLLQNMSSQPIDLTDRRMFWMVYNLGDNFIYCQDPKLMDSSILSRLVDDSINFLAKLEYFGHHRGSSVQHPLIRQYAFCRYIIDNRERVMKKVEDSHRFYYNICQGCPKCKEFLGKNVTCFGDVSANLLIYNDEKWINEDCRIVSYPSIDGYDMREPLKNIERLLDFQFEFATPLWKKQEEEKQEDKTFPFILGYYLFCVKLMIDRHLHDIVYSLATQMLVDKVSYCDKFLCDKFPCDKSSTKRKKTYHNLLFAPEISNSDFQRITEGAKKQQWLLPTEIIDIILSYLPVKEETILHRLKTWPEFDVLESGEEIERLLKKDKQKQERKSKCIVS
jgi:hypothetical protein